MGSIYPGVSGPRWDTLGYDSYDLDKHIKPVFMDLFKWIVRKGRSRAIVVARTLDEAKREACAKRDWPIADITEVRAIRG
jgi:hypothetical protein